MVNLTDKQTKLDSEPTEIITLLRSFSKVTFHQPIQKFHLQAKNLISYLGDFPLEVSSD